MRVGGQTLARVATLINSHPRLTGPLVCKIKSHTFQSLLHEMDNNLAEIHKNLPKGTLFVVILGGANTSWLKW